MYIYIHIYVISKKCQSAPMISVPKFPMSLTPSVAELSAPSPQLGSLLTSHCNLLTNLPI